MSAIPALLTHSSARPARAARPLAVAVVTESWPPDVNGVARTVARLVDGLVGQGHRIDLVRPQPREPSVPPGERELQVRGVPLPRYPGMQMGLPVLWQLQSRWTAWRPDVVHIATEGPLGWSALRAARRLGIPVCTDFHTNFHSYSGHYGLGWLARPVARYLTAFHNRAGCTLVPTREQAVELQRMGMQRVRVSPRGVDSHVFDPGHRSAALREQWGVGPDDPVVLSVGRLAAEKNLDVLLDAFVAAQARVPQARLVLVGDGPLRAGLADHPARPLLAGTRTGMDLYAHYASADVFLFPSTTETFGNVALEAMASGLALVAFDCAAAGEHAVDGIHALLAPAGDAAAFTAATCRAVADAGLRARLRVAARERAVELPWSNAAAAFEDHLRALADGTA